MKSKKNTFVSRAAVGCVTTAIFLLLCIIKGIYPFGIATLDTVDFQSQWIPAYYHVWDVLHGDGSAFFDWRVGGGNNFAGVSAQFSLFSPFNLFFLFVKRSWIEKSMIVFLLIKLLAMGYGMRWFLKEQILKEERYGIYILAGSVGYAVNGYTLLYYGMGWLDVAAILPLLCYFFCRMAEREGDWRLGKNTLGYIVCLTLVFLINIPQAYMMCFFLIVFAGGYFFLKRQDQPLKKNGILKFGLTSLLSLGIAAVIFLPAARAMLGSYRLSGEEYRGISGYFLLLRQDGMDAVWKWVILGSVAVPLLFFVISGRRKREHIWQWYLVAAMVRVCVTQEPEKLRIRVSDTGCGIPEKYQQSIFQPFFRVDKSRSREYGGAGLGLSLVWEIANLHGGSVWVEESSDKGTTIAVDLPVQ